MLNLYTETKLLVMEFIIGLNDFLSLGGTILSLIIVVFFFIWLITFERLLYFRLKFFYEIKVKKAYWYSIQARRSWCGQQIRKKIISEQTEKLNQSIPTLKTLVTACPLLGLLGTVTGMIEVFEVMSLLEGGNTRAMAAGISKATIPTMAGMVGALFGIFILALIKRFSDEQLERFSDQLTFE